MAKHAAVKAAVPVEHRAINPTLGMGVVGVILGVLNSLAAGPGVLDALAIPKVYQALILGVVPPLVTFLSAYAAPHTPRPDLRPDIVETGQTADGTIALAPPVPTVVNNSYAVPAATNADEPPTELTCGH